MNSPAPARPSRTLRNLAVAAIALVLAVGAYWYWSPFWAVHQFRQAAENGDVKALNDRVDFPALRESLKGQLLARIAPQVQQSKDNPFAALGSMFGAAIITQMVDMFVRPEMLAQAVKTGKMRATDRAKSSAPSPGDAASSPGPVASSPEPDKPARWRYEREGVDRLTMYTSGSAKSEAEEAGFVFERSGFATWRLTELKLPE